MQDAVRLIVLEDTQRDMSSEFIFHFPEFHCNSLHTRRVCTETLRALQVVCIETLRALQVRTVGLEETGRSRVV